MQLTNNTILITGGSSGIGRELAIYFHNKGNKVIVSGRRENMLKSMSEEFEGMDYIVMDVSDKTSIQNSTKILLTKYPNINGIIHNAGIMTFETIGQTPIEEIEKMIDTNLIGIIRLNSHLLGEMQKNLNPFVMTVSSGLAYVPLAIFATYSATKAALPLIYSVNEV